MELGIATFVDLPSGVTPEQRMRELLEEATLADELGLDVFAIGEHHRPDFVISSPAVALAAIAARTSRIRLSSAVTVLSSDDPVRVFQQFAELDLISGGRAEIMAGRGSFIESFPLFGYDLDDYDELYAEKLDLLLALRDSERVTWSDEHRAPLSTMPASGPGRLQNPLPGVGRRRRHAAVGGARRHAGTAADDRDHRRPARALRATGGAVSPGRPPRPVTTPAALPRGDQHPRLRRRDLRGRGLGRFAHALSGDDEPDRPRARLGAVGPGSSTRRCARPRGALVAAGSPEAGRPRRSCSSTSCSTTTGTWRR